MKPKNLCNSYKIPPQGAEGKERDGSVYDKQDDGTEHEPGAEDFVEHEVAAQPASTDSSRRGHGGMVEEEGGSGDAGTGEDAGVPRLLLPE